MADAAGMTAADACGAAAAGGAARLVTFNVLARAYTNYNVAHHKHYCAAAGQSPGHMGGSRMPLGNALRSAQVSFIVCFCHQGVIQNNDRRLIWPEHSEMHVCARLALFRAVAASGHTTL